MTLAGADPGGGGALGASPPKKLEKIRFFGVKSWFFTRNTPTIFAPPSVRRNFLKCAPPNLKSSIRPWIVYPGRPFAFYIDFLFTRPKTFTGLNYMTGADPGFQVRGGGGAHLKKIAPSGGRREIFWGISCEKSRFYAKKSPPPPGSAPVWVIWRLSDQKEK